MAKTLASIATYPDGTPAVGATVRVRLVTALTRQAPGYAGSRGIYGVSSVQVAGDGAWTVEGLPANDDPDVLPEGTVYEVTVHIPGRHTFPEYAFLTAAGPAVQQLRDVLTDPPAAMPPSGLAAHQAATTGAHGLPDPATLLTGDDDGRLPARSFTSGVAGFSDLRRTVLTASAVAPVAAVYGVMWARSGNSLHEWDPVTETWSQVLTLPSGESPTMLLEVGSAGEVIVVRNKTLWRSTGWADPATATFAQVLDGTLESYFLPFSVATAGDLVMATEYGSFTDSRHVWLSQDGGDTFVQIFDVTTASPNNAHLHIAAIDAFHDGPNPRLWTSFHDDPDLGTGVKGVLYTDDLGQTWTTIDTSHNPTAAVATPHGMVFGSDDVDGGIYRVLRTADPADMRYERIEGWRPSSYEGLHGFAMRAVYDPSSQIAFVGFTTSQPDNASAIFASDGLVATQVWTHPTVHVGGLPNGVRTLMVLGNEVVAHVMDNLVDNYMLRGGVPGPLASRPIMDLDPGRVLGGDADRTSTAVGIRADAMAELATAIGPFSKAGWQGIAIGRGAVASDLVQPGSIAIGRAAKAPGREGVVIGPGANSTLTGNVEVVAIGRIAQVTSSYGVAVGSGSKAHFQGVAVGATAEATAGGGTALGYGAKSPHSDSFAIGRNKATNAANQGRLGAVHLELDDVAAPALPTAGRGRLYVEAGALKYAGAGTVTTLAPA